LILKPAAQRFGEQCEKLMSLLKRFPDCPHYLL